MRELVPSDIITQKLLRDGTLKTTETEVEDALESRFTLVLVVACAIIHLMNHRAFMTLYTFAHLNKLLQ